MVEREVERPGSPDGGSFWRHHRAQP